MFRSLLLSLGCEILLVHTRSDFALTESEIIFFFFFVQAGLHTPKGWVESVFALWVPLLLKGRRNREKGFQKNGKNLKNHCS